VPARQSAPGVRPAWTVMTIEAGVSSTSTAVTASQGGPPTFTSSRSERPERAARRQRTGRSARPRTGRMIDGAGVRSGAAFGIGASVPGVGSAGWTGAEPQPARRAMASTRAPGVGRPRTWLRRCLTATGVVVQPRRRIVEVRRAHDRRSDDAIDAAVDAVEIAPVAVVAVQPRPTAGPAGHVAGDLDRLRAPEQDLPLGRGGAPAAEQVPAVERRLGRIAHGVLEHVLADVRAKAVTAEIVDDVPTVARVHDRDAHVRGEVRVVHPRRPRP
jgi:hypothetical protein